MDTGKTTTLVISLIIGIVMIMGILAPICAEASQSSESVENEGAGWVRFVLDRNVGTTYSLSYTEDENGFYIDNSTDRQTYDDSSTLGFDTILYADSNLSVWVDGAIHILGTNDGDPVYLEGNGALTIVRDADGVIVTPEGEESLTFDVPTWAYIPVSTGNYGFYLASDLDSELGNGVKNYPNDMPLAVVGGGFAGVYAYNNIFRYNGLGLAMQPYYDDDGLFYGGSWSKTDAPDTQSLNTDDSLDPSVIDLDPSMIQPIDDPFNSGASLMAVPAPTYTDGVWGYDLITVDNVQKAAIVSYSGSGGDIVVPATVGGYDVYRLGKTAPSSTYFAYNVFDSSALSAGSTLTISDGIVEIGSGALFTVSALTGPLTIPNSVTTIGYMAFYQCTGFAGSLTLPDSVTYIGERAFYGCSGLTGSLTIPDSVTSIEKQTFYNCTGFTGSLTLPDAVTYLREGAFDGCSGLTGSLTIPDSVTSIEKNAFNKCSGFTGSLVIPDSVTSIGNYAFNRCSGFTGSLVIPDSVTSIGFSAFYGCTGFTGSLVISDSVTSIGNSTFYNCSGLTGSLVIPDSVTSIGGNAFYNCTGFTGSLVIPDSVTSIDVGAFQGCRELTGSLVIPDSVTSIGMSAFDNCKFNNLIIASDLIPSSNVFIFRTLTEVLDLSDTVDYSVDRYGIIADATVSDSIGDCFGFISVVEYTIKGESTPTQILIAAIPLVMAIGLVIGCIGYLKVKS